jgi:hypothetical protein
VTDETLLHRQIHPTFVQNGRVTSQAFKPTPKDDGLLSVYDGDLITAEAAWKHFTQMLKHVSTGVYALTMAECKSTGLPARPDTNPFPEHAVVDFTAYGSNQIDKKAKLLRLYAVARGWQFQAESNS